MLLAFLPLHYPKFTSYLVFTIMGRAIHALVDALGNPLKFILTPGQRNDITQAEALTKNVSNSTLVEDKGYDSNTFIASLENKGVRFSFLQKEIEKCKEIMMSIFTKSGI